MTSRVGRVMSVCAVLACSSAEAPVNAAANRDTTAVTLAQSTHVALDGQGLMIVHSTTGSSSTIPFGAPASRAIAAVTAALGAPRERTTNQDCGAGPLDFLAFGDGLLLNVQADRFVGWTVRRTSGRAPRTMSGIGLGSTRTELESAYAATIAKSSIGIEFAAGGLQGVLASAADTAPITDLWAGTNCVAR